jgi:uncharacterized protein
MLTRTRGSVSNVSPFNVRLRFQGDLDFFLKDRSATLITRQLKEKTSIKDVIESCGIPHPEVDLILVDQRPVEFGYVLGEESEVEVYPVNWQRETFFTENRLQIITNKEFIADVHLGKLVRNLRLLGVDVAYDAVLEDRELLELARRGGRALLTRDRRLLMHAVVRHGYYLRSQDPTEQTLEVLRRFQLSSVLTPFIRCLRCNHLLEAVAKDEIIDQLEPLTKIYYDRFCRCPSCGQVYWPGSHFRKLEARIANLKQKLIFGLCNSPKSA